MRSHGHLLVQLKTKNGSDVLKNLAVGADAARHGDVQPGQRYGAVRGTRSPRQTV